MILRQDKRTVPQLNTTSTADISFILLVFFLLMTSMDVDKGLQRMLPPIDDEAVETVSDVARSNVLQLEITPSGRLLADGKPLDVSRLRSRVVSFLGTDGAARSRMVMLDVARSASYDVYFNVQNEVVAAYNFLRDRHAKETYGKPYAACTPEQRAEVRAVYPQCMTETVTMGQEGGAR